MTKARSKRFASVLAVTTAAALLAAACGSDKKAEETTTTAAPTETTAAPTETTAAPTETTAAPTETTAAPTALTLAQMIEAKNDLSGVSCNVGAVLALTGGGSFYGKTMTRGIETAVAAIKAAGGPTLNFEYWDHESGNAEPGVTAMKEMKAKGITIKLASYVDDLGAMLGDTAANHVFTLDGGGGTSIFGQGVPFFWGTRAITPNDTLPGVFQYFKETYPDKKTVGLIGWELGALNDIIKQDGLAKIEASGLEFNGLYELAAIGAPDYSQSISKIKANEPDLLIVSIYGTDPGLFLNQAATAGIKSVMIGSEFTPDGVNASKGTYDSEGWTFAYDFFDPNSATLNPMGKLFVDDFRAANNEDPDFYAANFFENTVRLWQLMDRAASAGVATDQLCVGDTLEAQMQANPTLSSVYGGDTTTVGTSTHDLTTHSVNKRPMGIFTYKDGKVTAHAFFGINGEGYTKVG